MLNVDYKLLSKTLASRLASVLPDLIHQDQRGFIRHRYIGDNILDVYSLVAQVEEEQDEAWILLLDIYKAFDSVSWSFLRKVLDTFMFPDSFIQWIDLLYKDKEIRLINNGHISKAIRPTRGLAQGDGLSPLLFVLVIETLALAIRDNVNIHGIQYGNTQKKIGLLADDAIVAFKNKQISFSALLQTLEYFATVSNLMVNKEKSILCPVGANTGRPNLQGMEEFYIQSKGYFNYLGTMIPLSNRVDPGHYRPVNYTDIQTYVHTVLEPRNGLRYSLLGRILNVKAFVSSKLVYTFSVVPSPTTQLLNKLQSLLNGYIWSQGRHYISATLMYQPWESGGFNMYCCKFQDHSLKIKWVNRLLTDEHSYWSSHIANCFALPVSQVFSFNCTFTLMCKLLKPRVKLPLFWKDVLQIWCMYNFTSEPDSPGDQFIMFNSCVHSARSKNITVHKELFQRNIVTVKDFLEKALTLDKTIQRKLGIQGTYHKIPPAWLAQCQVTPPPTRQTTRFQNNQTLPHWKLSLHVTQSVKAISRQILLFNPKKPQNIWERWQTDLQVQELSTHWPRVMKNRLHHNQIKIRSFYVKYVNRAFSLNTSLLKWGVREDDLCSICGKFPETWMHVFWECSIVAPLWRKLTVICKKYVSTDEAYARNNFLLFGFGTPVLNLISTLCKYHIHIARTRDTNVDYDRLLNQIRRTMVLELNYTKCLPDKQMGYALRYWRYLTKFWPKN